MPREFSFYDDFFLVAPTLAKAISYLIRRSEPNSMIPAIVPTSIVSLVLFLAWLSHAIGMSMVPRGEVGLVLAELGKVSGLFNNEIYATVVIVIAYTTLFTPFWLRFFYKHYGKHIENSS